MFCFCNLGQVAAMIGVLLAAFIPGGIFSIYGSSKKSCDTLMNNLTNNSMNSSIEFDFEKLNYQKYKSKMVKNILYFY